MKKINLLLVIILLAFGSAAQSMNDIDNFIRDRCGDECNGESDNCRICYNQAVDLFDTRSPSSPEVSFDINSQGHLEFVF
jgi:hypothetical protein